MVGHKYTDEEKAFLYQFVPGHSYHEIVNEYNKRFTEPITLSRLKGFIGRHKLNTGRTGRFEKGIIPHNKGKHTPTVGRMAETQYKKGNKPHNTRPLGYERISKNGYVEVKVRENPNRSLGEKHFALKHRLLWEQVNGPIPRGYIVIFKDGNKRNITIDNLALISNAEHLQMIRKNLRTSDPKLTETGIAIAKVGVATYAAKKKK